MFVPNFKILGQVFSGEIFDENFHMHFLRVRDGKRKKEEKIEREGKIKSQHLSFVNSNTLGCPHCVYKICRLYGVALIDADLIGKNCWKERKKDK